VMISRDTAVAANKIAMKNIELSKVTS